MFGEGLSSIKKRIIVRRTVRRMFGELTVRPIKNGRYKGSVACFDFQTAQDQNSRTPREQGGRGIGACGIPFLFFLLFFQFELPWSEYSQRLWFGVVETGKAMKQFRVLKETKGIEKAERYYITFP